MSASQQFVAGGHDATLNKTKRIDLSIELLLIALLGFAPATFGAVNPWSELVIVCIGGAIALLLAARSFVARSGVSGWAKLPIVVFLAIAFLQLIPLPAGLIGALSPHTRATKRDLLDDLPDAPSRLARMTLTFYAPATRHDVRHVLLAATVFFAVATVYRDPRRIRRLLLAVTVIGAGFAALALAQDLTKTWSVYWRVGTNEAARSGPFFNHSHYAQFMNLSIGCGLAWLLLVVSDRKRATEAQASLATWWRAGLIGVFIVTGLATISLSLSRGGMLAIAVAGAFTLLVLLSARRLRRLGVIIALLGGAAVVALLSVGSDRVYDRVTRFEGITDRLQMVKDAERMVRDYPRIGVGLGAFQWIYPGYDRTNTQSTATHIENEYVQALVETGPVGLAAVVAFVVFVWWRWLAALRSLDRDRAVIAVGLSFGLVAVMVHSLTDFGQHVPAVANLSAVTCGLLVNLGRRREERLARRADRAAIAPGATTLAVAALATWAVVGAVRTWRADQRFQTARSLASTFANQDLKVTPEQRDELMSLARSAIATEEDDAHIRYWSAVWHWRLERAAHERGDPQLTEAARAVVAELDHARICCPTYGEVYAVLGQIERSYLDLAVGTTHIHTALRLAQNDSTVAQVAGELDARRGRWDLAIPEFRRAVSLDFAVMQDTCDLLLKELNEPVRLMEVAEPNWYRMIYVSSQMQRIPALGDRWKIPHERAADLLEADATVQASGWKFATIAAYRASAGRLDDAEKNLRQALELEPTNLDWRLQHAEVLQALGRNNEALAEAQAALRQHPNDPKAKQFMDELRKKLSASSPSQPAAQPTAK
jgi:O-antigen ligase/tetratricopeptide (TPR) repeat protein